MEDEFTEIRLARLLAAAREAFIIQSKHLLDVKTAIYARSGAYIEISKTGEQTVHHLISTDNRKVLKELDARIQLIHDATIGKLDEKV